MDINSIPLIQVQYLKQLKWRSLFGLILMAVVLTAGFFQAQLAAHEHENETVDYITFWSDYKNILLFKPDLIKTIFTELIDLKGNVKTAKQKINYEVLGCRTEVSYNAGCRIEQLKLLSRSKKLSNRVIIPVNFTSFSSQPYKNSKSRSVVRLSWRPMLFKPPLIDVDTFLDYVNAARNSKIYSLKPGIQRIQLIPNFQKHIEIVIDSVMARNLTKLYEKPHLDLKDSVTFVLDSTYKSRDQGISSFTLNMNAVTVKINHLIYRVQEDAVLY